MEEELMTPDGDLFLAGSGATTTFICACNDHDVAQPLRSGPTLAAVARLIDLLLIHAVRKWAMTTEGDASWLRPLRDPLIARTVAAVHERPHEPWPIVTLAAEVHVSRDASRCGTTRSLPLRRVCVPGRMGCLACWPPDRLAAYLYALRASLGSVRTCLSLNLQRSSRKVLFSRTLSVHFGLVDAHSPSALPLRPKQ
jgi:hypothetical protein